MSNTKMDFRALKIGNKVEWRPDDPWRVKPQAQTAKVISVDDDKAIAELEEDRRVHLWIDDDTADDYTLL